MRDSNPRMVGPEPTALPPGESPSGCIYYTTKTAKTLHIYYIYAFIRFLRPRLDPSSMQSVPGLSHQ